MTSALTQPKPNTRELIYALKNEFANRFNYSTLGSRNTIYITAFLLPVGTVHIEQDEIKYKRPTDFQAFLSRTMRLLMGSPIPMKPYIERLESEIDKFLVRKYG